MRYLSVCSGIEAASVAWAPLGWKPVAFSEIEPFPCSVLAARYPDVPNLGDMTRYEEWDINETVDLVVGGTPCQSFSIAGLRGGIEDARGNLALTYCQILQKFRPRWFIWENVPGVLSSNGGRDFGSILGAMVELGYGIAYRILDAQYFGVPQRRRRVFVVGCAGDWERAAQVLFEPGCVRRDPPKGRKKGKDVSGNASVRTRAGVKYAYYSHDSHDYANDRITDPTGVSPAMTAMKSASGNLNVVVGALQSGGTVHGHGTSGVNNQAVAAGHVIPVVSTSTGKTSHCLNAGGMGRQDYESETMVVENMSYDWQKGNDLTNPRPSTMNVTVGKTQALSGTRVPAVGVRRLTPKECERLQGFPDDWTTVMHRNKPAADGPRYKAIGNSMAVPVMAWVGKRIQEIEVR